MKKLLLHPSAASAHWEPKYPFDLVVGYEDLATRHRAMSLHDHLAQRLHDDFDFQCAWWKFDHLVEPTLGEQAVDDAAAADMIVLSLHAGSELPPAAQGWIESWSRRRERRQCALVTLFAEADARQVPSPLFQRLRTVARQARMDFFTNLTAAGAAVEFTAGRIAERARAMTPTLVEILRHHLPAPRCGVPEP